ncbi:MAG: glycerate kinase [Actinobacteria bacterium]|nr:glycerate kinase [Actinomycetota bacterium]
MATAIVCPDGFKGTFSAREVAAAVGAGLRDAGLEAVELPLADGGEGTLEALLDRGGERRVATVGGPLGEPVEGAYGVLDGGRVGVVEMAQASGLVLVPAERRDAWRASTRGTGELIAAAAAAGVERILVSVGGSATTDGGAGAIEALAGVELPPLTVLCDVETPWEEAAAVFGPQKGADPAVVARLAERLDRLASTLPRDPRGVPMTGCAGGLSGGLWATRGAALVSGADFVLDFLGFDRLLDEATLVVTGEGRLDEQSMAGKVVGTVAERARARGVPCFAVVGESRLDPAGAAAMGLAQVLEASTESAQRAAGRAVGGSLSPN